MIIRIRNPQHLRDLLLDGKPRQFKMYIRPNIYGLKTIELLGDERFRISNYDGTIQLLTREQLFINHLTLVGSAINKGNLIYEED